MRTPRPGDYSHLEAHYRPSHADYTYDAKYGVRDHRGGGRASARETAARVVAGALARQFLEQLYPQGPAPDSERLCRARARHRHAHAPGLLRPQKRRCHRVRCPDPDTARRMEARILESRKLETPVGGSIVVVAPRCPPGWGEPVFDKLHADLAKALWSLPAVKGLELGSGFSGTLHARAPNTTTPSTGNRRIRTTTNHSGGIQGGISNGEDIVCA